MALRDFGLIPANKPQVLLVGVKKAFALSKDDNSLVHTRW